MRLKLNKFWDVAYPFVFFMLLLTVVTTVVLIIGAAIFGAGNTDYLIQRFPFVPLLINVVFYAGTLIVQYKNYKKDDFRFGERKNKWKAWKVLAFAFLATVISVGLSTLILISPLPGLFPSYYETADQSFGGQSKILLILATVILGPMAEELIFRGLTYERLRHYVSVPAAVIITALMFGIYHANVIQFIYASIMGVILALYYEKSGSLIAPVVAHMVMNAMAVPSFF